MSRELTPASTLENLRREARRWLKALRARDAAAHARLARSHPAAPSTPTLRDVQHALAREHGLPGWSDLKREVQAIEARRDAGSDTDLVRDLFESAGRGDAARVRAVLDAHPELVSVRAQLPGHDGARTALHFAVAHPEVVRLLLERGADPNVRDDGDDAAPLHFAAERGDLEVVRLLVEHGADPVGDGTVHELNALGWAVCWDYVHHADVAEYLLAHGARHTIHTAVALGDVAAIRALVAAGPDERDRAMDRTNHRRRPLHLAVVKRQPAALATLLALGADASAMDASGLTPLDVAAMSDEAEMVRLLLAAGAELRLPAAIFLDRAADVERLLRDDGAALKPGGRWGTLIVRAAERGSGDVIERLIRAGASVNVRDTGESAPETIMGFTPLHAAAYHGNTSAAAALLRHGADPNVRESKWCATAAGWAAYAGHAEARDLILRGRIDLFQAIDFQLYDRVREIARRDPELLEKRFHEYADCASRRDQWYPEPWHTPLAWAVTKRDAEAVCVLLEQGAAQIRSPEGKTLPELARAAGGDDVAAQLLAHARVEATHAGRVRWFIEHACPDHHIRGGWHHAVARNLAERLLRNHPEIAADSFCTAVVCGDLERVERELAADPEAANRKSGPKGWEPLLYLCFTRLPSHRAANENALAIARLLLDSGADPNAYFMAGDSRYTPLVGVIGEGEEDRPAHPERDALVRLLLERGAEPYDMQVVYNIHFRGDVVWYLELMYEHAVRRGRSADWQDPEWRMLDMGAYGSGARWFLDVALKNNDVALMEWLLSHGANPNAGPATDPRFPRHSPYEEAVRRGHAGLADLLRRYGAQVAEVRRTPEEELSNAALKLDAARARDIVRHHPELLHSPNALFEVVRQDRVDAAALLLDLGISPDVQDRHAQRPLHVAAGNTATRCAQLLIDRGAEIDPVETQWNATPLGYAVHNQDAAMIALLGRYSGQMANLVFSGQVDRVRELLREQPELASGVRRDGGTLLMWLPDDEDAALELAELLLAHGADPAYVDANGLTAADQASRRGMVRSAALLRAREAGPQRAGGAHFAP